MALCNTKTTSLRQNSVMLEEKRLCREMVLTVALPGLVTENEEAAWAVPCGSPASGAVGGRRVTTWAKMSVINEDARVWRRECVKRNLQVYLYRLRRASSLLSHGLGRTTVLGRPLSTQPLQIGCWEQGSAPAHVDSARRAAPSSLKSRKPEKRLFLPHAAVDWEVAGRSFLFLSSPFLFRGFYMLHSPRTALILLPTLLSEHLLRRKVVRRGFPGSVSVSVHGKCARRRVYILNIKFLILFFNHW